MLNNVLKKLLTKVNPGAFFTIGHISAYAVTSGSLLSLEVLTAGAALLLGLTPSFMPQRIRNFVPEKIAEKIFKRNFALYINGRLSTFIIAPASLAISGSWLGTLIAVGFGVGNTLKAIELDGAWDRKNVRKSIDRAFNRQAKNEDGHQAVVISAPDFSPQNPLGRFLQHGRNVANTAYDNLGLPELPTAIGGIASAFLGASWTPYITVPAATVALIVTATAKPPGSKEPGYSNVIGKKLTNLSDQGLARGCFLLNNVTGAVAAIFNADAAGVEKLGRLGASAFQAVANTKLFTLEMERDKQASRPASLP